MADQKERWLTLRQVRALLIEAGMEKTDQTIRNWGDTQKLRTRRSPGRQRHFAESSVRDLIKQWQADDNTPAPPAETP